MFKGYRRKDNIEKRETFRSLLNFNGLYINWKGADDPVFNYHGLYMNWKSLIKGGGFLFPAVLDFLNKKSETSMLFKTTSLNDMKKAKIRRR